MDYFEDPHLCLVCFGYHPLKYCKYFKTFTVQQRIYLVGVHRYCAQCFSRSHLMDECTLIAACDRCHGPHHTMLHAEDYSVRCGPNEPTFSPASNSQGNFRTLVSSTPRENRPLQRRCSVHQVSQASLSRCHQDTLPDTSSSRPPPAQHSCRAQRVPSHTNTLLGDEQQPTSTSLEPPCSRGCSAPRVSHTRFQSPSTERSCEVRFRPITIRSPRRGSNITHTPISPTRKRFCNSDQSYLSSATYRWLHNVQQPEPLPRQHAYEPCCNDYSCPSRAVRPPSFPARPRVSSPSCCDLSTSFSALNTTWLESQSHNESPVNLLYTEGSGDALSVGGTSPSDLCQSEENVRRLSFSTRRSQPPSTETDGSCDISGDLLSGLRSLPACSSFSKRVTKQMPRDPTDETLLCQTLADPSTSIDQTSLLFDFSQCSQAGTRERRLGERTTGERSSREQGSVERRSGERESGQRGLGERGTGERRSGERSSGDRGSRQRRSGECSPGDRRSRQRRSEERRLGEPSSGERQSGQRGSGERQSDQRGAGERRSGERRSVERSLGKRESGERRSGERCLGERELGEPRSGECGSNSPYKSPPNTQKPESHYNEPEKVSIDHSLKKPQCVRNPFSKTSKKPTTELQPKQPRVPKVSTPASSSQPYLGKRRKKQSSMDPSPLSLSPPNTRARSQEYDQQSSNIKSLATMSYPLTAVDPRRKQSSVEPSDPQSADIKSPITRISTSHSVKPRLKRSSIDPSDLQTSSSTTRALHSAGIKSPITRSSASPSVKPRLKRSFIDPSDLQTSSPTTRARSLSQHLDSTPIKAPQQAAAQPIQTKPHRNHEEQLHEIQGYLQQLLKHLKSPKEFWHTPANRRRQQLMRQQLFQLKGLLRQLIEDVASPQPRCRSPTCTCQQQKSLKILLLQLLQPLQQCRNLSSTRQLHTCIQQLMEHLQRQQNQETPLIGSRASEHRFHELLEQLQKLEQQCQSAERGHRVELVQQRLRLQIILRQLLKAALDQLTEVLNVLKE